ncbi:hypothetical protein K504DRAFT_475712 [Pleomassaria siparia CBS 279.74]|uniref:Uncharacterized protein n=1 Tax=Pleomassaria siparia CBS 279.74 TaxID=1314801 RepID=A0A6G1KCZ8_9PLEO|nr:hypothetical protein K504DRAFT_475712 [Pleomassaria siparia CBS 279.74]
MAAFVHFLKTIFIPLFLAAILYLLLAHLILPFVRRHRTRYSQYLPMPAGLTASTSASSASSPSWRTRISDALYNLFVPSSWGWNRNHMQLEHHEDELFDDEEGEGMVGFDPIDERRREALEQRRSMMGHEDMEAGRRLSRELEEGFKDDSDDEDEGGDERRRSLSRSRSGRFY